MPTPVAHSLIGLALGMAKALPRGGWWDLGVAIRKNAGFLVLAVFLANAPDLDYVPGILAGAFNSYHHYYTHTLGWSFLVALGVWCCWKAFRPSLDGTMLLWLWLLPLSHLIADYVTPDTRAPYGIMAVWPFDDTFILSPLSLFRGVRKASVGEMIQWHNVVVMASEILKTLPLVVLVLAWKRWARPVRDG